MRQSLLDLGCPPEKVVVQQLGVSLDQLPFVPRRPDPSGVVRILIAATFREKKGIPDALRAVARARRHYPRLEVTLLGDASDKPGDREEKARIMALLPTLEGAVRCLGFQPYSVFRQALLDHHLFLSPSRTACDGDSEGGAPVSLLEAQATGMPVLSTRHADIPEVVVDGKSGLLSPEGDLETLAANLMQLIRSPALWEPMGAAGRAHVELSPDGMNWVAEGTTFALPSDDSKVTCARVAQFGNWLRIRAELPEGSSVTVVVTIHVKA
jgi:colanic acid/amylovoran biosynthesis glycosyltransferase